MVFAINEMCPDEKKRDLQETKKKWGNFKTEGTRQYSLYKKSLNGTGIVVLSCNRVCCVHITICVNDMLTDYLNLIYPCL